MEYVEVYDAGVLDLVNIGKTINQFDERFGDYIKVEIFNSDNTVLNTLYSNRLLLDYPDGGVYIGPYHYHSENPEMGFCTGEQHTESSITNLVPISLEDNVEINNESKFKKQVDIFNDSENNILIKPNELIKLLNVDRGKYKLRIHFLRNIKSSLSNFLRTMQYNLIENGNFFAGIEATQTGDLDRSTGKNNFIKKDNPGLSPFVLEQNGLANNVYKMVVTGIEPNSVYVFSSWVAWSSKFNGFPSLVKFSNVSSQGNTFGLPNVPNTDNMGTFINTEKDRLLGTTKIGDLTWFRLYSVVQTDGSADLGTMEITIGHNPLENSSDDPLGRRYFTDLRLEKIESITGDTISQYFSKLKSEIKDNLWVEYKKLDTIAGVARHKRRNKNKAGRPDTTFTRTEEANVEKSIDDMIRDYNLEDIIKDALSDQNRIQVNEIDSSQLQQERATTTTNNPNPPKQNTTKRQVTVNQNQDPRFANVDWKQAKENIQKFDQQMIDEMNEKRVNRKSAKERWLEAQAKKGNN